LVRKIEEARELGIDTQIKKISFEFVMDRMRKLIYTDIDQIREGLSNSKNIDYYHEPAEFVGPYTMRVRGTEIKSKMIFLCIGSKVTIIGRNPQFVPEEEPEVSALAKKVLGRHINIITNHEVKEVREISQGLKELVALDRKTGKTVTVTAREIMMASGRGPITDILRPEKSGIKTTPEGWIAVNEYLETSQPGIWALGDADGKYLFKHVANYESAIVYYNAILKRKVKVDYHAVPHGIFTYPEIAGVGMKEQEAI